MGSLRPRAGHTGSAEEMAPLATWKDVVLVLTALCAQGQVPDGASGFFSQLTHGEEDIVRINGKLPCSLEKGGLSKPRWFCRGVPTWPFWRHPELTVHNILPRLCHPPPKLLFLLYLLRSLGGHQAGCLLPPGQEPLKQPPSWPILVSF